MVRTGIKNCDSTTLGTWFEGCKITMREIKKIFLLSPKANISADDVLSPATIAVLIKKGWLVPLNEILQVTEASAKNNFQTFANKIKLFISQGLYELMPQFEANICYVKALHRLASKNWQVLLLDDEGKLFFDHNGTKFSGFDLNTFNPDNETLNDGGSKAGLVDVSMQFSKEGTFALNERRDFKIDDEDSSYFFNIKGIQDVKLTSTVNGLVVTTSILSGCDGTEPVLGLTLANFRVRNATTLAVVTPTAFVDNNDGTYTFTLVAGAFLIQLYDSVGNYDVTDLDLSQFYRSNIASIVLV